MVDPSPGWAGRDLLLLLLGWLLGVLSPTIERAILRRRRRDELLRGLAHECHELRFTLANALFSTRRSMRELDQGTVDLVKPILLAYTGESDSELVEGARELFATPAADLLSAVNNPSSQRRDLVGRPFVQWPSPYTLPLLEEWLRELDLFVLVHQERLLRVSRELQLFNEQVAYVRHLIDRSYSVTGENHRLNEQSSIIARRNLGHREERLVRAIDQFIASDGTIRES
jgi:hypothetical protein